MDLYIIILAILFLTAATDLMVGVANDAVNFLNSAIGSKAATRRTIMLVASLGVLIGTTFSAGIMEVARKGIFDPQFFTFHEVMIIFLAVMITDILLLDFYNTFSLPTSTTVSIVFEILGGAVAISVLAVMASGGAFSGILERINVPNVILIVSGIGLSIIFAFIFGFLIQFATRLLFTFDYQKTFRKYGPAYCGAALTVITYFILVKGAKGSTLIPAGTSEWLSGNLWTVLGISYFLWWAIWTLVMRLTKINILKVVVLIGTFALALAFAANDLVNFIGAPLGALTTYQLGDGGSSGDPLTMTMGALAEPVTAPLGILTLAGFIMIVTLWVSRKGRGVTKTEVNLGRQTEGVERFKSTALSRLLVSAGIGFAAFVKRITPRSWHSAVAERINPRQFAPITGDDGDKQAFDLLRATVNLMVASALISLGTALKLPLSTTFVTFIVAMSTSLADRSWGRESAENRVSGVLTVIGGWFVTAFLAFSACFMVTMLIYFGELPAIVGLLILAAGLYFILAKIHRNRSDKEEHEEARFQQTPGHKGTTVPSV